MRRLVLLAVLLVGCESSTSADPGGANVVGSWSLKATQTAPPLQITGVVRFEHQDGASVAGAVETRETSADGQVRNRVGSLSGRVLADDAVDFDVFVDAEPRRHVGRVRGDSIVGSWAQSTGGAPLTGAFTLRRTSP